MISLSLGQSRRCPWPHRQLYLAGFSWLQLLGVVARIPALSQYLRRQRLAKHAMCPAACISEGHPIQFGGRKVVGKASHGLKRDKGNTQQTNKLYIVPAGVWGESFWPTPSAHLPRRQELHSTML